MRKLLIVSAVALLSLNAEAAEATKATNKLGYYDAIALDADAKLAEAEAIFARGKGPLTKKDSFWIHQLREKIRKDWPSTPYDALEEVSPEVSRAMTEGASRGYRGLF